MNRLSSPPDIAAAGKASRAAGRLDRLAIGLSSLCVVHCIATVVLAATLASAGAALADPAWHEIGFAVAMLLGAVALGRGFAVHRKVRPLLFGCGGLALMGIGLTMPHGAREIGCTVAGVLLLALAHRLNAGHHAHAHGLASARRVA
ncbi:MAG TPA: MerC domain-containing protein [Sphingomonas sp.]